MRVRSAQTLVFSRQGREIVGFNFLTNSAFACSHDLLAFLTSLDEWTEFEDVVELVPEVSADELRETLQSLIEVQALSEQGSPLADAEENFRESWKWGVPAALFHFSVQDKDQYISIEQAEALQREKLEVSDQPELYQRNDWANGHAVALPSALEGNELIQLMARRRTFRSPEPVGITVKQL